MKRDFGLRSECHFPSINRALDILQIDFIRPLQTEDGVVAGVGRVMTLEEPIQFRVMSQLILPFCKFSRNVSCTRIMPMLFQEAIKLVKSHLKLAAVRTSTPDLEKSIRKIAICAGSGSSVFKMAGPDQNFDLLLTGEMSHHDTLEAVHQGKLPYARDSARMVLSCLVESFDES